MILQVAFPLCLEQQMAFAHQRSPMTIVHQRSPMTLPHQRCRVELVHQRSRCLQEKIEFYLQGYCFAFNQNQQPPFPQQIQKFRWIKPARCVMKRWLVQIKHCIKLSNARYKRLAGNPTQGQYRSIIKDFVGPLKNTIDGWKQAFCHRCEQNYANIGSVFPSIEQLLIQLIGHVIPHCQRTFTLKWTTRQVSALVRNFQKRSLCIPRRQPRPAQQPGQLLGQRRSPRRQRQQ